MGGRKKVEAGVVTPTAIVMIGLHDLELSELNVRKTDRDADIAALADDIAQKGLKQNLIVVPVDGEARRFEVIAGGRRYQALSLLAGSGRLDPGFMVPCLVEASEESIETSLSENLHRVAMNPVDEFVAYRTIIARMPGDVQAQIAATARRFGKSAQHVEQRLRLANLPDDALEALKDGTISLEIAMALAATEDRARQQLAWDGVQQRLANGWHIGRRDVLALLHEGSIPASHFLSLFVGRDAYVAAGGGVELDLFAQGSPETFADRGLVMRLALDKLTEEADRLREAEGLGDVRPVLDSYIPYELYSGLHQEWGSLSKARKAEAIAFVVINDKGEPELRRERYFAKKPSAGKAGAAPKKAFSQSLIDSCAMERRDVLAAVIAGTPDLAYDIAAFTMAQSLTGRGSYDNCFGIRIAREFQPVHGWAPKGAAADALAVLSEQLDSGWCDRNSIDEQFLAFRELDSFQKAAWVAAATASALQAAVHGELATGVSAGRSRTFDVVGALAGVDVRSWWTPTAENYFGRIGKDELIAAGEAMGADTSAWGKAKKGELAKFCEVQALTEAGRSWLPAMMAFPPLPADEPDGDGEFADGEDALETGGGDPDGLDTDVLEPEAEAA